MRAMDDANTDLVTRVDKYTTLATRASRFAEAYISGAFQLAVETTDAGNAKYLAQTKDSKKAYQDQNGRSREAPAGGGLGHQSGARGL